MKYFKICITIIAIILLWLFWSLSVNNSIIAPTPLQTLERLLSLLSSSKAYKVIGNTLLRLLLSLSFSVLLGITLGFLAGFNNTIKQLLYPIITILRTIPVIAVILIILMVVGKEQSPIIITFLMIFPITYQAVLGGIIELKKEEYMEVYKLDSRLNLFILFKVYFLLLIPFLKIAIIQSIGLGVKVLIMAEFTSSTKNSIGREMLNAYNNLDFDIIFAWTIILIVIVIGIELLINIMKKRLENMKVINIVIDEKIETIDLTKL